MHAVVFEEDGKVLGVLEHRSLVVEQRAGCPGLRREGEDPEVCHKIYPPAGEAQLWQEVEVLGHVGRQDCALAGGEATKCGSRRPQSADAAAQVMVDLGQPIAEDVGEAWSRSWTTARGTPASVSVLILRRVATSRPVYRRYPEASRAGSGRRPYPMPIQVPFMPCGAR